MRCAQFDLIDCFARAAGGMPVDDLRVLPGGEQGIVHIHVYPPFVVQHLVAQHIGC
ncbi:hypothetical protein D3C74_496060 [compost metagenome]